MSSLTDAVLRGANLLDEHDLDWHNKINLSSLDQNTAATCVLGQTFGGSVAGFLEGKRTLHITNEHAFGFDCDSDWRSHGTNALTLAWHDLITRRRAASQLEPTPAPQQSQVSLTVGELQKLVSIFETGLMVTGTFELNGALVTVTR